MLIANHAVGGPNVHPTYNANGSDSENEDYQARNALGERIKSN